ncbi:hypothetical protein Tco_1412717, partial [Tanacetum coccineum]
ITWTNIYEAPPHVKKSSRKKRQLMLRPQYPLLYGLYYKNELPPVNSISEICVVIDDAWKVGDMVDWYKDDCYWSARVIKVLSNDKIQIKGEFQKRAAFKNVKKLRVAPKGSVFLPDLEVLKSKLPFVGILRNYMPQDKHWPIDHCPYLQFSLAYRAELWLQTLSFIFSIFAHVLSNEREH